MEMTSTLIAPVAVSRLTMAENDERALFPRNCGCHLPGPQRGGMSRLGLRMPILKLGFTLVLIFGLSLTARAETTLIPVKSSDLEGLAALTPEDRARIAALLDGSTMSYTFEDDEVAWRIHRGDLDIADDFINEHALVVDGNLTIDGLYDDYAASYGGPLIVLGELRAEHVFTWYGMWVKETIEVEGLLYGYYNDWATESGGVEARGVIMDDHSADLGRVTAAFELYDGLEDELEGPIRHLVPEVYANLTALEIGDDFPDPYALYPDYEAARAIAWAHQPLFRSEKADGRLMSSLRSAAADNVSATQLRSMVGFDPLVDRVIAARPKLPEAVIEALLTRSEETVRSLLASQVTDLNKFGGAKRVSPKVAASLVANSDTTRGQLRALTESPDAQVRRALTDRVDLPVDLLERLAADADAGVRSSLVQKYDNGARLASATVARLADDGDRDVREAVAMAHLTTEAARKLVADTDREVRSALAYSLVRIIDHPNPRITESERHALATTLFDNAIEAGDGDLVNSAFMALPESRQLSVLEAGKVKIAWNVVAMLTVNEELMARLLDRPDNLDLHEGLAGNPALPEALQLALIKRAGNPGTPCEDCWGALKSDNVLIDLAGNDNVAPAALVAAAKLAAKRPQAGFVNELTGVWRIPIEGLEALDRTLRGSEDWALSVVIQQQATRALLEPALPHWYDDADIVKAIAKMRKLDDSAWWHALSTSPHSDLRKVAARNIHTSAGDLVDLLDDDDSGLWIEVCLNPGLPQERFDALEARGLECLLGHPALGLEDIAEFARTAPTYYLRKGALERYQVQSRRSW